MSSYGPLAAFYDSLTEDVGYGELYRYLRRHLTGVNLRRVLDMACGTGSLALLFAEQGIETVGMDLSRDMVARAKEKCRAGLPLSFEQGNMADFSLEKKVDAVVCMLDSFNYLTDPVDAVSAIGCFYEALNHGGKLIFDVRPRRQLMDFDDQMFMDETEDVVCVWRTEFDEEENLCYYDMDLFIREGDLWHREREEHVEYAYRLRWLRQTLLEAGFTDVRFFGDRSMMAPSPDDGRVFITAGKE